MTQVANFVWPQGEDLVIEMIYKEGSTVETATAIDLSSGYELRMDIIVPSTKERVYTFNTSAIADVDPTAATIPDSVIEGTLTSGVGGTPNITIQVPRALTLPGGAIYAKFSAVPSVSLFNYDVFLRNSGSNRQSRILKGTVQIEESYTLWQ